MSEILGMELVEMDGALLIWVKRTLAKLLRGGRGAGRDGLSRWFVFLAGGSCRQMPPIGA